MQEEDKPFFLQLEKKDQLTKDAYTFYFRRNSTERDFTPGQTYEMKLPHKNMDERGDSRVFTISSSPTDTEFIAVTTRIIQSSFKQKLGNLETGMKAQFTGPWDDLNFDENDKSPHVFLAGGIGITPYHSIISYCQDKNIKTPMILFVSWKTRDEMVFDEFFRQANNHLENFSYVPTLTEETLNPSEWDGESGRIDEKMITKYVSNINESKYFISGPPAFVTVMKQTVLDLNVPKEKILFEEFEGY